MKRFVATFLLTLLTSTVAWAQQNASSNDTKTAATATEQGEPPTSVKPGINSKFTDPELNVEDWIARFEVESREVYQARAEIMKAMAIQRGSRVADIGAGTGFFTILMSKFVGEKGWIYAVEISPKFTQHLTALFAERDLKNTTTVFCNDRSVCLPPNSIDLAFICDVYHHFEFPKQTMTSIHDALSDSGRVILIDFERIPGTSRDWTLSHVRAGKETFIDEVQGAGFELVGERQIAGFKENYFLEFRKTKR
jgi:predicted methyltransferase